jgi:hypothetical protein
MSRLPKLRRKTIEFVERWDAPFATFTLCLFGLALLLSLYGYKQSERARRTAECIDFSLLGASTLVGCLRWWNSHLTTTQPPNPYQDPLGLLPRRDESERGLAFFNPEGIFGYPKYRFFIPKRANLDVFIEWSDEDPQMHDANPAIEPYQRRILYQNWYDADVRSFLVMQSKRTVGAKWETKAISIILQLPHKSYTALKDKELAVIDLRREHLTHDHEERGEYLLYDTLIIEESLRKTPTDFKFWHSLFHLSLYSEPTNGSPVSLLIEPDNPKLAKNFTKGKYGSFTTFKTINGHTIYEFRLPESALQSSYARRFVRLWRQLRESGFQIQVGS